MAEEKQALESMVNGSAATDTWRLNLDSLTDDDLANLAKMAAERIGSFGHVEGVAPHGLRFAAALRRFSTRGPLLIADDVMTTATEMERQREDREAIGIVILAMGPTPAWIKAIFGPSAGTAKTEEEFEQLKQRVLYWAPTKARRAGDAFAAIDTIGTERNQLILNMSRAGARADLVDEAALVIQDLQRIAQERGEVPFRVRSWLARYDNLTAGHDSGC
jgi:hypothetical protein